MGVQRTIIGGLKNAALKASGSGFLREPRATFIYGAWGSASAPVASPLCSPAANAFLTRLFVPAALRGKASKS